MGIRRSASGGYYPVRDRAKRATSARVEPDKAVSMMPEAAPPSAPAQVASMGALGQDSEARVWSAQQQAIFTWLKSGKGHLVVRARAGTGKTSTIIEAITHAPEDRILLAAFNKRIAVELQERLDNANAEAVTLHSIGYRSVRRYWEGIRVDEARAPFDRATTLARAACGDRAPDPIVRLVAKLHTKAREMQPHADKAEEIAAAAVAFDCAPDDEWAQAGYGLVYVCERAIEAMVLAAERRPSGGIDFADMIYLPIRNKWLQPQYSLVCIDECQDMNQAQLEIAQGVLVRGGRIAVVGDDRQAIYGFRGADSNSLDRLKQELRATELGLTTTYRCGRRIVAEAAKIVPDIVAREGAHEGVVREATLDDAMRAVTPGDYILSRVNAPLVRIALTLIRQSKRAKIEGRDIGKGLRSIAVKLAHGKAATSLAQWHRNLDLWELKEADRAERADLPGKVDVVHDQADTLRALADSVNSVREIEARIETLFSDVGRDGGARAFIVCSSVHRAKGLEADRVWVLRDTLYPPVNCQCGHRHGWGKADCGKCKCRTYRPASSAQREEANIAYCAITRAKDELVWVSGK